jgi:hypothetical protein
VTVFSSEYHVGEDDRKNSRSYHISAVICAVALIVLGLTTAFVGRISVNEMDTVPSFEKAIDEGRYADALSIYRGIQDEVLKTDPEDQALNESKNMLLDDMENIVRIRVDSICDHIISSRYVLTASDVNFLNSMSELTSSVVSERMYRISEDFLLGKIEKPVVMFFFEQLSPIGNFSATANPLLRELDYIETATGDVQTAETALGEGDYITAVKKYTQVDEHYDGFVGDYCEKRVSSIKATMYEPMMEEGEHMLETYRYYSAEKLFSDLAAIFPDDDKIRSDLLAATGHTSKTVEWRGHVEVLCVRSLIANTETAFGVEFGKGDTGLYLTGTEFNNLLETLYAKGYVLVDPENMMSATDPGFILERNLTVPEGKKPLVIIIENLSYDPAAYVCGTCRRLVLNDEKQVCGEYMVKSKDGAEEPVVNRTAEAIGILDVFVTNHQDFTFNGSKGIVSIGGHDSCFGYVVSRDQVKERNKQLTAANLPTVEYTDEEIQNNRNAVKNIVERLKDTGWKFASCTYGYLPNARKTDLAGIVDDTTKWIEQIGSLIPDTHMISYPGGNYIYGTDEKAVYLKNNGFRIFFGAGPKPYHIYGDNYLYFDRTIISPNSMKNYDFSRLFENNDILDPIRKTTRKQ